MGKIRKPFQGVGNIIRFNWHFYLLAAGVVVLLSLSGNYFSDIFRPYLYIIGILIILTSLISLLVSFYVYDLSGLYTLNWLDVIKYKPGGRIINIHAGFDETSLLLAAKYPSSELTVLDFYDPSKHTEVSIKRARKAYPAFPATQKATTDYLPLPNNFADTIFITLSAHEIRNDTERIDFFKEVRRSLKDNGKIIVTEHLRDIPNFLAYNIGFFHFLPKSSWYSTFKNSALDINIEVKITPFITSFILGKHGITA